MITNLWIISDKHKILFLDLLTLNIDDLFIKKVNAQLHHNYDLENLDYLDKPIDARIFNEHVNQLKRLNNEIIQLWREVVDESVVKYHQEQASSKKNDSIVDDDTW